jgi:MscS family membrane protein
LLLLNALGVDLDALLALGGLGGLAIGIAGKDIFANFFGGLMLYVTKPFTIGDWISSPERAIEGRVEEIGWYSTRLRGLNRQPLYVPNAVFSTIILTNSSRMTHKRIEETLRVPYTPQEKMREMVDALQKIVDSHPDLDPKMEHSVFVDKFIRDAFLIKLVVYTKELSQQRLGTIKQDLLLQAGDLLASYSKRMT